MGAHLGGGGRGSPILIRMKSKGNRIFIFLLFPMGGGGGGDSVCGAIYFSPSEADLHV